MASTLNSAVYCRFGTSFSDIRTSVQTEISKFLLYVKSRHGHGLFAIVFSRGSVDRIRQLV
jgi:hypothetical protein